MVALVKKGLSRSGHTMASATELEEPGLVLLS